MYKDTQMRDLSDILFAEKVEEITKKIRVLIAKTPPAEPVTEPDAHGKPVFTYSNVVQCGKCNNSGIMIMRGENGYAYGVLCECDAKRKSLLAMKKSGLEEAIKQYRFDNFKRDTGYRKRMYDICLQFTRQSEYRFLYIGGQRGSGKTHIGTAICGQFIEKGRRTLYTIFDLLMNELKAHLNDEDYEDVLNRYGSAEVLYIDDFMKFEPTPADIKQSFDLINMRYLKNNRTIITSERFLDEIVRIDGALGGRIKQRCGPFTVAIARDENRDYRINPDGYGEA